MAIYAASFVQVLSLIIPGVNHRLGTPNLFYQLWDAGVARRRALHASVEIDNVTYDVYVAFPQPQSGHVLLSDGLG